MSAQSQDFQRRCDFAISKIEHRLAKSVEGCLPCHFLALGDTLLMADSSAVAKTLQSDMQSLATMSSTTSFPATRKLEARSARLSTISPPPDTNPTSGTYDSHADTSPVFRDANDRYTMHSPPDFPLSPIYDQPYAYASIQGNQATRRTYDEAFASSSAHDHHLARPNADTGPITPSAYDRAARRTYDEAFASSSAHNHHPIRPDTVEGSISSSAHDRIPASSQSYSNPNEHGETAVPDAVQNMMHDLNEHWDRQQQRVNEMSIRIASLEEDLVRKDQTIASLQRDNEGLELRVDDLEEDNTFLEGRVTDLVADNSVFRGCLEELHRLSSDVIGCAGKKRRL